MDNNKIKKYAIWARRELITRVAGKAASYGITQEGYENANAESIGGRVLSSDERQQRAAFITKIDQEGYEQAIEEVAYTWFNRFCALRYMEVNGYLPSHVRVFTNVAGEFKPQILDEAIYLDIDGLDMDKVYAYKESNQTEELYRYLLIVQCNALNSILPGLFQQISDYTELLLPDNLLREGSIIEQMITQIPEEDWTDQVQIIGWLYQYYNAEKKDEVFAALKKNVKITKDNISAATQLFTPDWIVRYMVENSLGRLWIEGHPNEELKKNWKYYLEEEQQEPEVEEQLVEIRKSYADLKPEDIWCIDPCCGSGHILVYMFDVLMQIYESCGYTIQEAVRSIIKNNLYGLDIDDRAAQLAYFAVMMKARGYDKNFFNSGIQPNVFAIKESNNLDESLVNYFVDDDLKLKESFKKLMDELYDAREYGSIINVTQNDFNGLHIRVEEIKQDVSFYTQAVIEQILPLIQVAETLGRKYDVVVTNPPYMGGRGMTKKLSLYVKEKYKDSKADLSTVFMEKCCLLKKQHGFVGMINIPVWMFISSYEKLRRKLFLNNQIINLLHFGRGVFGSDFGSCAFILSDKVSNKYISLYKRLYNKQGSVDSIDDKERMFFSDEYSYSNSFQKFALVPGFPIAYWINENFINDFSNKSVADYANVITGMTIGDNDSYLRYWYEVDRRKINIGKISMSQINLAESYWFPYNKGGEFRKWYGNNYYVVNWSKSDSFNRPKKTMAHLYLREGLTWSFFTSYKFSMRYFPNGFLWDVIGSPVFADNNILYYLLGFMNTNIANEMLEIINPTVAYQAIDVQKVPLIVDDSYKDEIEQITKDNIAISKNDWDSFEISWDFRRHPLVFSGYSLAEAFITWEDECNAQFYRLKSNEEKLNSIFINIYGLQDELIPEVEDKDITVRKADVQRDVKSLISYAVGCMFGRYSLDVDGLVYAGGEWDNSQYKAYQPDYNGILPICDDEYFTDDIVGHFVDFIRTVYGEDTLEENLKFIADALGGSGTPRQVIRKYFLNDFYKDHCKMYQKRPIYWLFDSGKKNGFKCLIYMHRYQPDTIARIRTDYVHEQQARYRTAMADLQGRIADATTSERIKLQKELAKILDQADELQEYEEKIHHLADQFIDIDLDDGVKVNYAKFQDVLAKIK